MKRAVVITVLVLYAFSLVPGGMARASEENIPKLSQGETKVLSLRDCVKLSIDNSFEVKLAKLDLYVTETDLMYAKAVFDTFLFGSIGYTEDKRQELSVFAPDDNQRNTYVVGATTKLPTGTEVTATWSDIRDWTNTIFVSKNPSHNAELSLEFRQPVLKNAFGFVDRSTITLTRLAIMNADLEMKDKIEAQIATTIKAYVDLLSAKRSFEKFEGILEKAERLYEVDKKNFDIGLREKVDLYASEANVANRQAEVIVAENNYKRFQENLKLIINAPEDWRIEPSEKLTTYPVEISLEDSLRMAFYHRRDYVAKKRDVEIRDLDLRMKGNEMWPEVDLIGSMKMNGLERDFSKAARKTVIADNTEYFGGIEINIPFENRQARSQYDRAEYEKQKALVSLKETERTIITEVVVAYNDTKSFGASLAYTKKAVELQSKKLSEEEKRYRYGRSTTKILIDYQRDLLRSELEDIKFTGDHRKAKVDLLRAMNTILKQFEDLL